MQGNSYQLSQLFADGGAMMYPLALCSLFALGVIIAKFIALTTAHRRSHELLTSVAELSKGGRIGEAMRQAEETPGPVAAILLSGLRRFDERDMTDRDLEKAIHTTGVIELGFLERGLAVLATIANVAPLMGFLGTVAGMISAFGAIAEAGQVDPTLVAGGIKVALITTATGLIVAVPVNITYNYFVAKIDRLIVEMEQGSAQVLRMVWGLRGDGPVGAMGAGESDAGFGGSPATT